jgi:hypothetical protein
MDPEIAELIGVGPEEENGKPEFASLFGGADPGDELEEVLGEERPSEEAFPEITELEEAPKAFFQDKNYYKIALSGEGEHAQKVHKLLSDFLAAQDPKDKSLYRGKLTATFWNLVESIVAKVHGNLPLPKLLVLRFGCLLPTLISEEQRSMLSRVIFENRTGEPVYFVDEWLKMVAAGKITASASDETKPSQRSETQKVISRAEKARGQRDVHYGLVKGKLSEIEVAESTLRDKVSILLAHDRRTEFESLPAEYNEAQKAALTEIGNVVRSLFSLDRDLARFYRDLETATEQLREVQEKSASLPAGAAVDNQIAGKEFNIVRQMTKMCVGRQGNHFPILMKQYFRPAVNAMATRENVILRMAEIEALDPGLFKRTFKGQTNRIVPYVILLPCYGDRGICWEPFERFNKATSRGRVAMPMFPKDLKIAVIGAMADLRWQVAKERAQHYWMEEGLTGKYYQWFSESKLRGDVKEYFIQDYILWITKESEGTQKLDRDVRGVFWRYTPFPEELKEKLKNRGFVYGELAKRDKNRAMSDGY